MYYQSIPAAALLWKQNICADITGAYMRRCWNERSWINDCTSSSCWEGPQKTIFTLWPDPTSYGKSMQISILFPPQHPFFYGPLCEILKHHETSRFVPSTIKQQLLYVLSGSLFPAAWRYHKSQKEKQGWTGRNGGFQSLYLMLCGNMW